MRAKSLLSSPLAPNPCHEDAREQEEPQGWGSREKGKGDKGQDGWRWAAEAAEAAEAETAACPQHPAASLWASTGPQLTRGGSIFLEKHIFIALQIHYNKGLMFRLKDTLIIVLWFSINKFTANSF